MFKNRTLSLHKARQILKTSYAWYQKKGQTLKPQERLKMESLMEKLDQALLQKNKEEAHRLATDLNQFNQTHIHRGPFTYVFEIVGALIFALVIATIVRQMWFEPYEIPTGSMRPTFKEQDHLIVSKTTYGINVPVQTQHFYFDPNLVERAGITIFSGDGMDIPDNQTKYFWIFPSVKRYVKRLMGKPGDLIYFYGGKIYGVDKDGNETQELLHNPWLEKLEYIPFGTFEGKIEMVEANQIEFLQMNQPIGKLLFTNGEMEGEVRSGDQWIKDNPKTQSTPHASIQNYNDFWGMRNFAMARLLTKDQLTNLSGLKPSEEAVLYLELRHHPSLTYPQPKIIVDRNRYGLHLSPLVSYVPLKQEHLNTVMQNMYTARFVVSHGMARRYSAGENHFGGSVGSFQDVPDGTYELYYGKGYKISWGGISSELPKDHPLLQKSASNIQRLYNLGIEFSPAYEPRSRDQTTFPSRYAYFREGALFLLGAPILKKEDPILQNFLDQEMKKEKEALSSQPYTAFKDYGPPVKQDGSIDREFLQQFGLKIPEKHYLVLGDNHAMSGDSRYFGFVPQENLQGTPSLVLWPRWSLPDQYPNPWMTLPHIVLWVVLAILGVLWLAFRAYQERRPIYNKILFEEKRAS